MLESKLDGRVFIRGISDISAEVKNLIGAFAMLCFTFHLDAFICVSFYSVFFMQPIVHIHTVTQTFKPYECNANKIQLRFQSIPICNSQKDNYHFCRFDLPLLSGAWKLSPNSIKYTHTFMPFHRYAHRHRIFGAR